MFKKKERLASIVFVALLYLFLLSGLDAYAQNLSPSRDEVKATYCIAHLRVLQVNYEQQLSETGSSSVVRKEINDDFARLDGFLEPRIKYLDRGSLKAAVQRGADDTIEFFRDIESCVTNCRRNDAECSRSQCVKDSAAGVRLATCKDLSFLPF